MTEADIPPVRQDQQIAEAAVIPDTDKFHTEISSPVGSIALSTEVIHQDAATAVETTESQVHPSIEHKRKVEQAFFGPPESLIEQIDKGELSVDDTDFEDRTAVMIMTSRGHTEAVKYLIDHNADLNRINMYQGRIPMSALDAARQTKRNDIEQLLLSNGAKSGRELQAERLAAEQNQ